MKPIKYISLIFLTLLAGCDLNMQPISEIGEGGFYKNASEVSAAVVACYNGMQEPLKHEWALTEVRSDNARVYNSVTTSNDNTLLMDLDQAKISSTNSRVYEYWLASYHNIARCNTVFKNLDVVEDQILRDQFEGEVSFIRAYHYFNLVRLYGPLFIVNERISADEARKRDRSSVKDVYKFITDDLKTAIDKLGNIEDMEKGRATVWAAKGLMAKVRMTNGLIDKETKELLEDIYKNSGHRLLGSYEDIFSINNELNDEIIFTVRYTSGGYGLGSPFGNYFAPQQSGASVINYSGNGYNYPTDDLTQSYSSDDTRMDVTIALTYVNDQNQVIQRSYVKKYLSQVSLKEDAENDWPILRFADIILLYAEVINELEGASNALPYLNEIRIRAGLSDIQEREIANKHEMRMAIEKERRLELAYENHRWFDLIRTERIFEVLNSHFNEEAYYEDLSENYEISINSQNILLPIPQKELDINQNITQNPGY